MSRVLGKLELRTDIEAADLSACEEVVRSGCNSVVQMGLALGLIRDLRLGRGKFDSFEAYCQTKWQYGRRYVNQMISAAQVFNHLGSGWRGRSPARAPLGTGHESFPS
jgi:hypothetical protein